MSEEERRRWDHRYGSGAYRPRSRPSRFLEEWIERIPIGRALDVACGAGRHALRLAEVGFDVTAVDISGEAIELARAEAERRRLAVEWTVADLDEYHPERSAFAAVTVFRYANHDLWPRLVASLRPDGWILVEHHLQTSLDVGGPSTPEFRLRPGELLDACSGLRVVYYAETLEGARGSDTGYLIARIAACNGDPGW